MKNIEERKFSMYEVTFDLLTSTDSTIIDLMPMMSDYRTHLGSNIISILNHGGTQKLNRKGVTDDKDSLKSILITKASDAARKVQGYAVNIGNLVLLKEVKYSSATLYRLADNILVIVCTIIYEKAKANVPALIPYGIDDSSLTDFKTAIDNYDISIPKPRTGIVTKKVATMSLKQLFANTDSLLKDQTDVLVGIVKDSYPEFYANYTNSRKIINPPHHPLAIRCHVVDDLGAPVAGVTAVVAENGMTFKTKTKGYFYVKNFPEGIYEFTFSKEGYVSHPFTVVVANGERTDIKVTLSENSEMGKVG